MKFTDRFAIDVDWEEARRRFVNRAYNRVFYNFYLNQNEDERYRIHNEILSALGERYSYNKRLSDQIGDDFYQNLLALEAFYHSAWYNKTDLNNLIIKLLDESEIDLGVRWEKGRFIKSGAKLLDGKLVDDVLHWLRAKSYISVIEPFEKGLKHLLHSDKRPEILPDVITDMYEALEALSKIITERPDKDLSANRELFVAKVKASSEYKKILAGYINYANQFRHAAEEGNAKPSLTTAEVESFVYLTGVFIRLAIQ